MASSTNTAASFWDENVWQTIPQCYWSSNPILDEYINQQIIEPRSANSHISWWMAKYHPNGVSDCLLSLACGGGHAERIALREGSARRTVGYDVSPKSLEHARLAAEQEGFADCVHYELLDLNNGSLPREQFDAVISFGCLHHIENLEGLYAEIAASLRPGGVCYINEYVGPNRFQYSDALLHEVNKVIRTLPAAAIRVPELRRISSEAIIATDPSEAVRSVEVDALLHDSFDVIDGREYGGGLLYALWAQVIDPEYFMQLHDPRIVKLLGQLCQLDAELTASGTIENLFVSHVLCPRGQQGDRRSTYDPKEAMKRHADFVEAKIESLENSRAA